MTIYATPFDPATLTYTALSTNSGFTSIDEVVDVMGEAIQVGHRIAIYEGVVFTDMPRCTQSPEVPKR